MKRQVYYSNAKLILTGEYAVLRGATAIALPLKYGQSLTVEKTGSKYLEWKAYTADKLWFSTTIVEGSFEIAQSTNLSKSRNLNKLLQQAVRINPAFGQQLFGNKVTTRLDFNPAWGWGSSSTWITNVANWADIDPYQLHFSFSNGSGYDIACASARQPVLYSLIAGRPVVKQTRIPDFLTGSSYCVYLGKKRNSEVAVKDFKNTRIDPSALLQISAISRELIKATHLDDCMELLTEHEQIISEMLDIQPVQKKYFPDFKGFIKSLGAWGGDFILAVSKESEDYITKYFSSKSLHPVFNLSDIIR